MEQHNEKLVGLSKGLSEGNIQKSWATAKKLTRPSKATHIGSLVGVTIGTGLLCGGLIGVAFGKSMLGAGGLTAGAVTVVSNIINLKKRY